MYHNDKWNDIEKTFVCVRQYFNKNETFEMEKDLSDEPS